MSRTFFDGFVQRWEASGRDEAQLITNEWLLLQMRCWVVSDGAKKQGDLGAFEALVVASFTAKGTMDWYDALLGERHHCAGCGERYLLDNLHLCSKCGATYCTWCRPREEAPNGNLLHHCGGEIVG